ncbi:hypothetical protein YC2023_116582 [Brassica napus]
MRTDDLSDPPPPPPSSGDLPIQSRDLPSSSASPRSVSRDSPWSKSPENVSVEVIGAVDGDAPHIGSIHATTNRLWMAGKNGSKIDVQFLEKNTVLFRIENPQARARVLQRKDWHIADVPLKVEILKKHSGIAIVDSVVEGSNSGVNDDKEQGLKLDDTVSGTQSNPPLVEKTGIAPADSEMALKIQGGNVESFVFNEEHQNWSLVNGGPRSPTAEKSSDKQVGESSHGMETAIIVFPSRFNVLAVSEDENEDETEIEKGEVLVEEVMEATLPREKDGSEVPQRRHEVAPKHLSERPSWSDPVKSLAILIPLEAQSDLPRATHRGRSHLTRLSERPPKATPRGRSRLYGETTRSEARSDLSERPTEVAPEGRSDFDQ